MNTSNGRNKCHAMIDKMKKKGSEFMKREACKKHKIMEAFNKGTHLIKETSLFANVPDIQVLTSTDSFLGWARGILLVD